MIRIVCVSLSLGVCVCVCEFKVYDSLNQWGAQSFVETCGVTIIIMHFFFFFYYYFIFDNTSNCHRLDSYLPY